MTVSMTASRLRHRRDHPDGQRGSMSIELVLITPVLVGLVLTVAGAARYVEARNQVNAASYAAARAASLEATKPEAIAAGEQAADRALEDRGRSCATLEVTVQTSDFQAGGAMRVTVTCTADLSDVVGFGLPGAKKFTHTAIVPIEETRRF